MKKSNYISIATGLAGVCIGAVATAIFCKKMVEKEVKDAVDEKVKDAIKGNIDTEKLNKEVVEQTASKIEKNIEVSNEKIDKKLNNFNERLEVMEDVDAKKLDVAKAGILAIVTISTTLITSYYNNRNYADEDALLKTFKYLGEKLTANFTEIEERLSALEVK